MNADTLIFAAKLYSEHSGRRLSTIGAYAVNDGKFFDRIEGGGSCTLRTAQKMLVWLSEVWPGDLDWPDDIPRPVRSKQEAA